MKHLIFILSFLLLSVVGFSQNNIVKGTGVCYTNGEPTVSVNTDYYCEIAIDTTTGFWYEYQRDSSGGIWVFAGYRLQPTYSSGTPTFEPTDKQSYFVVNDDFELFYWKDNVWNQVAGGGGGGSDTQDLTATAGAGTLRLVNGGYVVLNDSSSTNEIQSLTITASKGTIRLDNGGGYVILADSSLTNEIQTIDTFEIASNILRLSISSDGQLYKSVDLSSYLDNTDTQDLTATAGKGTIRLVDGDFVVLNDSSSVNEGVLTLNTESSSLYSVVSNSLGSSTIYFKEGTNFDITRSGDTLILSSSITDTDTDDQTLSWNGANGQLTISEGNTVDLDGRYLESEVDGSTTNEIQSLTATAGKGTLRLDLGGGSVVLNDSSATNEIQTISILGGGGTINLSQSGGSITLNDSSRTNEIQYPDTFLISGNYLKFSLINDGRLLDSVSLSAYLDNTDAQTLDVFSTSGNTISASLSGDGEATKTASIINSNTLSISGNIITGSVNSQSDTVLIIGTHIVNLSGNQITSNVNGVTDTVLVIASNVLAIGSNLLTSTINGQASNSVSLAAYLDNTDSQSFSGSDDGTTFTLDLSGASTDISFKEGTGITITRSGTELTFASSGSFTTEDAQDAVGAMINASLQYVDGTPLLAINDRDNGDITTSASGLTWTIDNGVINAAKLGDSAVTAVKIISNAVTTTALATNSVTNLKINDVAWSKITGAPTTLSGYGITDALSNSTSSTQDGYFGDIYLKDDTSPSHYLQITNAENLTGSNKVLSIVTGNADRTLTFSGDATISGTNTGDQTITLTGDVTGSGTGSFAATIADNSVDGTDIALGSDAQGDIMYYDGTNWARLAAGTNGHFLKTQGAGANPTWAAGGGGSDGNGIYSGAGTIPNLTYARLGTSQANMDGFAIGNFTDSTNLEYNARERGIMFSNNAQHIHMIASDSANLMFNVVEVTNTYAGIRSDNYTFYDDDSYVRAYGGNTDQRVAIGVYKDAGTTSSTLAQFYPDSFDMRSNKSIVRVDSLLFKIGGSYGTNGQVLKSNGYSTYWATDATGGLSDADYGDITVSSSGSVWNIDANTITTTEIAANEVGDADLRQGAAMTVIGRSANSTGNVADIATSADNQVLRRSGTTLGFGTVATGGLADSLITSVKILSNAVGTTAIASGAVTNLKLGDSAVTEIKLISNSVGTTALKTSAVSTLKIADNAVTGEKIAMGSDAQGDIIYYDGTNYVRLGAGTSGQFLKTNGTGANPAWATAATLSDGDKGDITLTSSATVWTIDNDVVTFAKMQNVAANSFLANASGSSGDVAELALSASQLAGRGSSGNVAAITLGTGLSMSGTTLSATGSGGDIVNGGNTTGATVVIGTNDNNGLNFEIQDTAALSFSTAQVATFTMSTSTTNALVDQLYIDTKTYNTAASGLGGSIMFKGESTTTESQAMATIGSYWTTATHASREAALTFQLGDNAGSLAEVLKISRTDLNGFGLLTLGTSTPLEISNDKLYQAGGNYTIDVGSSGTITMNGITKFENQLNVVEQSAPSTPSSGRGYIYEKTDNILYFKNDAGTEFDLTATGSLSDGDKGDVDVTSSGSVWTVDTSSINTVKILDNTVANADFRQSAGYSVVGRATSSTGNVADITAGADLDVLYRDGSTLTWGKLYGASLQNNEVSLGKLQQLSANTVLGNATGSSGNVAEISLSASNLLGRGSSGNVAAITAGQGIAFSGTVLSGGVYAGSGNIADNTKAQVLRTNDFAIGYFQNYPTSVLDEDRGIWFDDEIYIYANDSTSGDFSRMYSDNGSWTTKSSNGSTESYVQNSKNYTQTYTSDGTDQSLFKIGSDSIYTYSDRYRFETDSFKVVLSGSAGTNGQVLKSNGSVLYWAADNAGGGLSDGDYTDITVSASGTVWNLDAGVVTATELADSAVTAVKIISNAVGTTALATGAVTTLKIASNSVDGTKIALGSDAQGDVMYYDGTNWARLAPGTSGQFLKTNGAAANPAWADAGASVSDGDKGDITVTSSGATWTIDNGVITSARIADGTIVSGDVNDDHIILQGGNTIGESVVIGSNDANTVSIESNNVVRATVTGGASTGGAWTMTDVTSKTNTVENILTLTSNSTGTAAASFGTGILFQGESSTTNGQDMAQINSFWSNATHASREAGVAISLGNSAGALEQTFKFDRVADQEGVFTVGSGETVAIATTSLASSINYTLNINDGNGILTHYAINYFSEQAASPSTPSSGYATIYPKTDGATYIKNDAGLETNIAGTIISPSQLTSDQDDYNPTGFAAARLIYVSSNNGMRAITSMPIGLNGEEKTFINTGTYPLYFPADHPDGSSSNRIKFTEDIILMPKRSITFIAEAGNNNYWHPINYNSPNSGNIIEMSFVPGAASSSDYGVQTSAVSGSGAASTSTAATSTIPLGNYSLSTGTTSTGGACLYTTKTMDDHLYYGAHHLTLTNLVYIPTLSNGTDSFTVFSQFTASQNSPGFTFGNSAGIMYSHGLNGGKWTGYTTDISTTNKVDLGVTVAANTSYLLRTEIDKSRTEVRFYINDVYVGRSTSNIPAAGTCGYSCGIKKGVGTTARTVSVAKTYIRAVTP